MIRVMGEEAFRCFGLTADKPARESGKKSLRYERMMKRLGIALAVSAIVAGCGGGGAGTEGPNPFAGHFAGSWSQPSGFIGQPPLRLGQLDVSVDTSGAVTGTFSETSPNRSGALTGEIRRNGNWTFSVVFSSETVNYNGSVQRTGNVLNGSFIEAGMGGGGFFPSFQLAAQP